MPFEISVAGVTFEGRQAKLEDLYLQQTLGAASLTGELKREPDNAYDPNAVMVLVTGLGEQQHVGYIPRALAERLAARMDSGQTAEVLAVRILRGEKDGRVTYGVRVDVEMKEVEPSERTA